MALPKYLAEIRHIKAGFIRICMHPTEPGLITGASYWDRSALLHLIHRESFTEAEYDEVLLYLGTAHQLGFEQPPALLEDKFTYVGYKVAS